MRADLLDSREHLAVRGAPELLNSVVLINGNYTELETEVSVSVSVVLPPIEVEEVEGVGCYEPWQGAK